MEGGRVRNRNGKWRGDKKTRGKGEKIRGKARGVGERQKCGLDEREGSKYCLGTPTFYFLKTERRIIGSWAGTPGPGPLCLLKKKYSNSFIVYLFPNYRHNY